MRKILIFVATYFILAIFLIGCSTTTVESISATAWSDNSDSIAFIEQNYENHNSIFSSGPTSDNIKYRLGVINRDGTSKKYISDFYSGSKTGFSRFVDSIELFYRSDGGYFVMKIGNSGRVSRNGVSITDDVDIFIIDTEGNENYLVSKKPDNYCEFNIGLFPVIRSIPSPNGNTLATIQDTINCNLSITFVNSGDSFSLIENQVIDGIEIIGLFWVDDSHLLINSCLQIPCNDNWNLIKIGENPRVIDDELFLSLCLDAVVVGSDINSIGEQIIWSDPDTSPEIRSNVIYSGRDLNWSFNSDERKLDDPNNCVSIGEI